MIRKYKKKAIKRLCGGFGLFFLGVAVILTTNHTDAHQVGGFIGTVAAIVGYMFFVFGCADLLKAKGYDSSISLAFVIPALCCSVVFIFLAPPIIFFGLKDKYKDRD